MYLSYSGYKKLVSCAFAYWHDYINKTELPTLDDRLGSIYGTVVGRLFERFYVEKVWRVDQPQALVMSWVEPTVDTVLKEETSPSKYRKGGVLLWQGQEGATRNAYASREQIVADARDAVARGFHIIRRERLLGPRAEAEVKLDQTIDGHRIAGRADFIVQRTKPHHDLTITDGKGSRYKDKYVDKKQLVWYAMLLQRKENVLPDRVGFIFWRCAPDEAMQWFDLTQDDVDSLFASVMTEVEKLERAEKTLGSEKHLPIVAEVFPKNPSEENCMFCPYASEEICPEGLKARKKTSKSKARKV